MELQELMIAVWLQIITKEKHEKISVQQFLNQIA